MTVFLSWISGVLCTLASLLTIVYLFYYTLKRGFKPLALTGLFLLLCTLAFLLSEPERIPEVGSKIVYFATQIFQGDMKNG